MTSNEEARALSDDVDAIVAEIKPILAGLGPLLQGAVLNELVSIWIAGHAPELREQMLAVHVETVKALVPINAAMIRGE